MRASRKTLLICALAALLPLGFQGAQAATATAVTPMALGPSTPIDAMIDHAVNLKAAQLKLSATDRLVAREQMQMQFRSLSPEKQREIIAAMRGVNSEEGVVRLTSALAIAVRADAERALADMQKDIGKLDQRSGSASSLKLGTSSADRVFVATAGPCRVADTRVGIYAGWPGPVNGFEGRQIWGYSSFAGYDFASEQGGTGIAGSGNCAGAVYGGAVRPDSVVVTITVIDSSTGGALRAWDGTPALTVGAVLAWNAGDRLSNTTVVPMDRLGARFNPSGPFKRDFAVYNNSGTPVNVVADVVGYFIVNQATALDCTTVDGSFVSIPAGGSTFINAPACATGYTAIAALPETGLFGLYAGTIFPAGCRINNATGGALSGACNTRCCRIPGR